MTTPLVVARFKSKDQTNPRFTKTTSIEELMVALMEQLPVDLVYFVVSHPDGKGYSLREAGVLVLDLLTGSSISQREEIGQPTPIPAPEPSFLPSQMAYAPQGDTISGEPMGDPSQYAFEGNGEAPGPFQFSKPKSQDELLAERGIVEPKQSLVRKKGRGRKSGQPVESDEALPNPVSRGRIEVTAISTATPAEAAAASQFGKH